jgi:hypothetical protein
MADRKHEKKFEDMSNKELMGLFHKAPVNDENRQFVIDKLKFVFFFSFFDVLSRERLERETQPTSEAPAPSPAPTRGNALSRDSSQSTPKPFVQNNLSSS